MKVVDDLSKAGLPQETFLSIGTFDGVHRGHQQLIQGMVNRAHATDRLAAVVTFHPHPAMVLAPERAPRYLTTPKEKVALLEGLGLDLVVLLAFNRELAAVPAREFMRTVAHHLRPRELWVGADFALGRDREGDVPCLQALGQDLGYVVHVVDPLNEGGKIVSSSRVRALLQAGKVGEAARLLGRYPSLSGEVVSGAQRGHQLGFPTANLKLRPERAVPADGVYAVFAQLGEERRPAVANVGVRPSFENAERTVEVHVLDFHRDIYGCDLVIEFVDRLRDERRFTDVAGLVSQIARDCEAARAILGESQLEAERLPGLDPSCSYRYREVEHTADRALQVWGDDLSDLFVGAARGMYSLMADLDGLVVTDWREIHLEAWDRESLLIDWLNELLFYTDTEGLLFVAWQIDTLADTALVGRAGGVRAPGRRASIKAATFHDLALEQDATGWSTVITFDV